MRIRFATITFGFAFIFLALGVNLYRLQVEHGLFYAAKAAFQAGGMGGERERRGGIYLINENGDRVPVALDRDYPTAFAVPKEIDDAGETANLIAPLLGLDPAEVERKLSKPNDQYELLAQRVTKAIAQQIEELRLTGIYIRTAPRRFYPGGSLLAHVVGFVAPTDRDEVVKGRYGIELLYDDVLRGGQNDDVDIELTIDRNIEARVEDVLAKLVGTHGAESGTIIIEEPATGKILAMASYPTFDPGEYGKSPVSSFLNPAVQAIYEPGSVFKIFTMAAGIDSGSITPDTTYVDTGSLTLNGKTIANWKKKAYGKITMTEVIEHSVNTGAAFAARRMGVAMFRDYAERFGFGVATGITLPGELRGSLKSITGNPRDINLATASFGQGVAVTPLQLISAISAIANGGMLMRPYLTTAETPTVVRRVVSRETASAVTAMMVNGVQKNVLAAVTNYTVAGKTGTAQIPDFASGGYSDAYVHTYAGFAPASNPRFTILVKLDRPKGNLLAGVSVVPAFKNLTEFLFSYLHVPPDAEGTVRALPKGVEVR